MKATWPLFCLDQPRQQEEILRSLKYRKEAKETKKRSPEVVILGVRSRNHVFVPSSTITSSEFDMENAFSTINIHNYTSASSATSGSTSFNSLEDSRDGIIPPTFSLFYNNPYLKSVQAFYAIESPIPPLDPITPPTILTPSMILPPSLLFNPRYFLFLKNYYHLRSKFIPHLLFNYIYELGKTSIKMHAEHHEKQTESILNYLEEPSFHCIEKMKERFVNDWIIMPRISDLEITLEDIQDRHQLYMKNLMEHTS
ncbi:hypothetical protein Tco_0383083 [Tanacetum coccineum]